MAIGKILRSSISTATSLVDVVSKAAMRSEVREPLLVDGNVRVSMLHKLCARKETLRFIHKVSEPDDVDADLGLTFAMGSGMHHAMQNQILGGSEVLEGMWRCMDCGALHGEAPLLGVLRTEDQMVYRITRPEACTRCDSPGARLIYEEYFFVNKELGLQGHCDGLLKLPAISMEPIIFECKSMAHSQAWKIKDTPILDHVVQVHGYMLLTGLRHAIILYWLKGIHGAKALKEFRVERDEDTIAMITKDLQGLREGLRSNTAVEARVCAVADCERAMECPVRKACFENYLPEPDGAAGLF